MGAAATTNAEVLERALEAHGGLERWRAASEVRARLRTGGVAFYTRFATRYIQDFEVRVDPHRPRAVFDGYPEPGRRFVFEPERTRIETDAGDVVEERPDPRSVFPWGRRAFRWDRLDMMYFAGYALWNYLTTPFMLAGDGFETREIEPYERRGERMRRLAVTFPDEIPTHCREQVFFFGEDDGLLRRLDYTADPIGPYAVASHLCLSNAESGGWVYANRRRVVPRAPGARPLPGPPLVTIEVDRLEVI